MNNKITNEDIMNVAKQMNVDLTQNQIAEVLKLYPDERLQDAKATWNLIIEHCINSVINDWHKIKEDSTRKMLDYIEQHGADCIMPITSEIRVAISYKDEFYGLRVSFSQFGGLMSVEWEDSLNDNLELQDMDAMEVWEFIDKNLDIKGTCGI